MANQKLKVYFTNHKGVNLKIAPSETEQGLAYLTNDLIGYWDTAERLVSCWNACIPFENPEEDIKKLVDALKESCTIIHNQIPYERNHDVAERLRDKDLALRQTLALYKNTEE